MNILDHKYTLSGKTAAGIADSIERGIREGALGPGEVLPPTRALAASLSVSPATVAAAYRTVKLRGLVSAEGRSWITFEDYAIAFIDELEKPAHSRQRYTIGY